MSTPTKKTKSKPDGKIPEKQQNEESEPEKSGILPSGFDLVFLVGVDIISRSDSSETDTAGRAVLSSEPEKSDTPVSKPEPSPEKAPVAPVAPPIETQDCSGCFSERMVALG
jgi:hypothetical protein